jgi:hypothetical protein
VRLFCHISEFREVKPTPYFTGAAVLPVMLFLSNRLSLWSPSAGQFSEACERGQSKITPEDLVEFVRERRLQVIGRRWWLTDPAARAEKGWSPHGRRWVAAFDDPIAEMALEDDKPNLPAIDRRVLIADDEAGWDWADKQIKSTTTHVTRAQQRLSSQALPGGFLEKARQRTENPSQEDREHFRTKARGTGFSFSEWIQLRTVLRDTHNHEEAVKISGCDAPVEPSKYSDAIPFIAARRTRQGRTNYSLPSNRQLGELVRLAASFSKPRNASELRRLLDRKDRSDLVVEMEPFMKSPNVALELHKRLETDIPGWLSIISPLSGSNLAARGFKLVGFAGLVTAILSATLAWVPEISLVASIIGYGKEVGERLSVFPAPNYHGPKWPMVLGYDETDPTYAQIKQLRERLLEYFHAGRMT